LESTTYEQPINRCWDNAPIALLPKTEVEANHQNKRASRRRLYGSLAPSRSNAPPPRVSTLTALASAEEGRRLGGHARSVHVWLGFRWTSPHAWFGTNGSSVALTT